MQAMADSKRLWEAVQRGDLATVQELAVSDNATIVDKYGWTLLHCAAHAGQLEVAHYLAEEKGLDPAAKAKTGFTPLHWACEQGHLEVAKYLLERGADVDERNNFGCTPLHYAASRGHVRVAEYLIVTAGASTVIRSRDGKTAFDFATNIHLKRLLYLYSRELQEIMVRVAKLETGSRERLLAELETLETEEQDEYWVTHPDRHVRVESRDGVAAPDSAAELLWKAAGVVAGAGALAAVSAGLWAVYRRWNR